MSTLQDINEMIDEFTFKHLISDTGIIRDSDIVELNGMNFKYSFKNSPNDLKQVELINDTMSLLEIIKIHINTFQEEEYNAEDESDIAKYTPGWTVDEDGRPVQIDNVDVDDMMEDMTIGD